MKLRTWVYLLLIPSCYLVTKFCRSQTDAFTSTAIASYLPPCPEWHTEPPTSEVDAILNQKFHYLTSGGQSFVFISEDKKYVLKFFKLQRILFPSLLHQTDSSRIKKVRRDFASYLMAWQELREETALVYLHLNRDLSFKRTITLVDKLHCQCQLNLEGIPFVLQKNVEMLYPYLDQLLTSGKEKEAEEALCTLFALIIQRCQKGILDEDPALHKNVGFFKGKPIILDAGRFIRDPQRMHAEVYSRDLQAITTRLEAWIKKKHPTFIANYQNQL